MNVDSILPNTTLSLDSVNKTSKVEKSGIFPESISKRLDVLTLLSSEILITSHSKFSAVVKGLNSHSIDYHQCKLLFIEAYIQDFNENEREYFLNHFFEHFDPKKEVVQLNSLGFECKDTFWENIILYFCDSYMEFPAEPLSLIEIFTSHLSEPETAAFKETEEDLETRFDRGLDLLLDFSLRPQEPVETKILFVNYLARLILKLEDLKLDRLPLIDSDISIEEIFEELYVHLLNFPYLVNLEGSSSTLFSLMKEDLKRIDPKLLNMQFIDHLISHLKDHQAPLEEEQVSSLKEVLSPIHFLD